MKQTVLSALAVCLFLVSGHVSATTVVGYDFEGLCSASSSIVHARVVDQTSEWHDGHIMTRVTIEIIESLKGAGVPGEQVTIFNQGGVVGNYATWVPGAPRFLLDEEVILFLETSDAGDVTLVTGLNQGKFTVLRQSDAEPPIVTRSLDGLAVVLPDRFDVPAGPDSTELLIDLDPSRGIALSVPLANFLGDIRHQVEFEASSLGETGGPTQ